MKKRTVGEETAVQRTRASLRIALLLLFVGVFVIGLSMGHASTSDEKLVSKFLGKDWVNGRSWEKLDYSGKLGFVCGLFDGITLFWSASESGKKADIDSVYHALSIPANLTVGDVVKGIDEFYGDAANMKLPAICAYLHFAFKQRGDSRESLEKRLGVWRKMFNR
jgi:hypothetical protein